MQLWRAAGTIMSGLNSSSRLDGEGEVRLFTYALHIASISLWVSSRRAVPSRIRQVCAARGCKAVYLAFVTTSGRISFPVMSMAFTPKHIQNSMTRLSPENLTARQNTYFLLVLHAPCSRLCEAGHDFANLVVIAEFFLLPTSACHRYPCAFQETSPLNTTMYSQVQDSSWISQMRQLV